MDNVLHRFRRLADNTNASVYSSLYPISDSSKSSGSNNNNNVWISPKNDLGGCNSDDSSNNII